MNKYDMGMATAITHEIGYKRHKERLRNVRGHVDCGPPFHNPHVYLKLKKMEYEERKNVEIDNANKNLLRRLQKVLESDDSNRRKGKVKGPFTLQVGHNYRPRMARLEQIKRDNVGIAYRIGNMKPFEYNAKKLHEDYMHKKYLQSVWATNNNEQYNIYNPTPRTHRSMMSLSMMSTRDSKDFKPEEKHKEEEEDNYEDDFEEGDEKKDKKKEKENKLPPIAKTKKTEKTDNGSDTRRSKAEGKETTKTSKEGGKEAGKEAEYQERKSAFKSPYTDHAQL